MKWSLLISVLSHVPIYITTFYSLAIYKKLNPALKIFSWFLFVTSSIQFVSLLLALKGINNMPLLHLYVACGFSLLTWFYAVVLKGMIDKRIIPVIGIMFLIFTVINSLFFQNIFTFNSIALSVESILLIVFSLSTSRLFLNDSTNEERKQLSTSLTWINSGLFIYYSSNLLIYYFGAVITRYFSQKLNLYTWVVHSFFSVIMYIFIFMGLWKRSKT